MTKKNDKRPKVMFSAAKLKRLPMPEKLVYLRTAFAALGNGLQVLDRRRAPPRTSAPLEATAVERQSLFRRSSAERVATRDAMLSRAQFEQLTLENKMQYLATAFRQLKGAGRRVRVAPAERDAQPPPAKPIAK